MTEVAAQLEASRAAPAVLTEGTWRVGQQPGLAAAALARLGEAEELMAEAKHCLAALDEPAALRHLARAESLLAGALAVPGAAAFYAETQLQLGVTAAQLGLSGLAAASFARAARMDPGRRLLAGEATPDVAQLAARAFDDATSAPEGEARIVVDTPGARVFLDDIERGTAPLLLRARTGVHALRIEAAGRTAYGGLFDLAAGSRPDQQFALNDDPAADAAAQFQQLSANLTVAKLSDAARALLLAAPELGAVAWLTRDDTTKRTLLYLCERRGCSTPLGFERGVRVSPGGVRAPSRDADFEMLSAQRLYTAQQWLNAHLQSAPAAADAIAPWRRWYFWSAVAAVLVGGGVLIAVAARPDPDRTIRVSVDPGALK